MDIKAKLVKAFDFGNIKGIFDVTLDDKFAIHGVKLIKSAKGDFISMPSNSYKNKNGETKYDDIAHPLDNETRSKLFCAVQEAYYGQNNPMTRDPGPDQLPSGW